MFSLSHTRFLENMSVFLNDQGILELRPAQRSFIAFVSVLVGLQILLALAQWHCDQTLTLVYDPLAEVISLIPEGIITAVGDTVASVRGVADLLDGWLVRLAESAGMPLFAPWEFIPVKEQTAFEQMYNFLFDFVEWLSRPSLYTPNPGRDERLFWRVVYAVMCSGVYYLILRGTTLLMTPSTLRTFSDRFGDPLWASQRDEEQTTLAFIAAYNAVHSVDDVEVATPDVYQVSVRVPAPQGPPPPIPAGGKGAPRPAPVAADTEIVTDNLLCQQPIPVPGSLGQLEVVLKPSNLDEGGNQLVTHKLKVRSKYTPEMLTRWLIHRIHLTWGARKHTSAENQAVRRFALGLTQDVVCGSTKDKAQAIDLAINLSVYPSPAQIREERQRDLALALEFYANDTTTKRYCLSTPIQ